MYRKWDITDETIRRKCIEEIVIYAERKGLEGLGAISAQEIIDIITTKVGPIFYNSALVDSKKMITDKLQDLEIDLDLLTQN